MDRWIREGRFVDRSRELSQLDAALAQARIGVPTVVLVAADAGVGKTRLLEEFATRCDGPVLWGACPPMGAQGLPFAPIAEALRALATDPELGDRVPASLGRLVSGDGDPRNDRVVSRSQLFQTILGVIEDLASRAVTVVVLEDLHWADPSTRDLMTFLVPNLRSQRVLVVASFRTDDLRRDHPLRPVVTELIRHPHVTRLDMAPFTAIQVAEQLEHLTGRRPGVDTVGRVVSRTHGNAYFIEELVAAGLDGRDLPSSLRELLLVRADVVAPSTRRLLRVASLANDDVGDALLSEVSGAPLDEVRTCLHEAVDALLVVLTPGGVRFRHSLLREALQHDLLAGERRDYHAAYAHALDRRPASTTEGHAAAVAELAHHVQESGDVTRALGAWIDAATAAEHVFAFAEAHQHLSRALAAWETAEDPARQAGSGQVQLLARTAEDAYLGGDAEHACDFIRQALQQIDETAAPRVAGILYERLSLYLRDTAERHRVYEMIERALRLVPPMPPSVERARVLAGQAGRLMGLGRLREARDVGEEAVGMARQLGSALLECNALNTLGAVTCYLDDYAVGLGHIERALALAVSCGDSQQQMRSYWNLGVCNQEAGQWATAVDRFHTAIEVLPRLGLAHLLPELFRYAADTLVVVGRWDEARSLVAEAARRFPSRSDEATSIELVVVSGDVAEARRLIAAWFERDVFGNEEEQAVAMVHLATVETWEGNIDEARGAVDAALDLIADSDRPTAAAHALCIGMRCEADAAEEARARRQADRVDDAQARGVRLHARIGGMLARSGPPGGWKREVRALAAICAGELSRLRGTSDPSAWAQAVAATQELSMAYRLAYAQFRHGEAIMAATGDRVAAVEPLTHAHQATVAMGAKPLRRLIEQFARRARIDVGGRAPDDPFGLTPRERQVLDLVAQGAGNAQIAEQLFISIKTASVHVSNIIRKLEVSNRGEAAAVAYRSGLIGG